MSILFHFSYSNSLFRVSCLNILFNIRCLEPLFNIRSLELHVLIIKMSYMLRIHLWDPLFKFMNILNLVFYHIMDPDLYHLGASASHMSFTYLIHHEILILKSINIIFIMSSISQLFFVKDLTIVKDLTRHMSFCKLFQLNSLIHCAILHMVVTFQFDYLLFISM